MNQKSTNKNLLFNIIILILVITISIQAQNNNYSGIINLIDGLNPNPDSISFHNELEINNIGGHLQGIQYIQFKQNGYYFLSGSSELYSYLAIIKLGDKNSVISINKILDKPFKHAGGFQIYKNLMAIGVEDNSDREKSKIFIYQIEDPENFEMQPLKIIERGGAYERVTAGCVAITEIKNNILVVVGDWDTKHLDFYTIEKDELFSDNTKFTKVYSIDSEKLDRLDWCNDNWVSYQNINFIKDSSGILYLAGMAMNDNEENIIDLFSVEMIDLSSFDLKKIFTKKFIRNDVVNFDWGTGIHMNEEFQLKIISCSAHIESESKIYIFK